MRVDPKFGKVSMVSAPDELQVRITFSRMGQYMVISERDNKPVAALDLIQCGQSLISAALPELSQLISAALKLKGGNDGGNT